MRARIVFLAAPLALVVGCGSSAASTGSTSSGSPAVTASPSPKNEVLGGTLELTTDSTGLIVTGSSCAGIGGYSDIDSGTSVVLTNENGTVIDTTSLLPGTPKNPGDAQVTCSFMFTFGPIPKAKFYSVEVSHRGKITESAAELKANDNVFQVTLGP